MKKTTYFVLLLVLLPAAFVAGSCYTQRSGQAKNGRAGGRKILYYADPMHPAYTSDKPGVAPDCGMELVPVYADGAPGELTSSGGRLPAGTASISAEKQQVMGVRVSRVEEASGRYTRRLFGRVMPDEARSYRLNAGIEGYIQDVSAVTTGSQVKKNQLLATFNAPSSTMAIQTYILNLGAEERFKKSAAEGSPEGQAVPAANANIQQRIQQLRNLGMSPLQIEEIKRTREIPESIKIVAPADGFVLTRNVSPGQKFERGAEWYRIADLRRVWILVDVFEDDAQHLRPGVRAQVSLPNQRKSIPAIVSEILPQFDPLSRTLKVRLEADNPGYTLRPDMFVDVELTVTFQPAITVPLDAVLDSGRAKTIFVEREEGVFEPRAVETGWRSGDRVEIIKGLTSGERIAVSGNFLISSESQLRAAATQSYEQHTPHSDNTADSSNDPACGMEVDVAQAKAADRTSQSGNTTYYFCSESCKRKFDADPARYLNKAAAPSPEHTHPLTRGRHG